jgi:hypothetical protein
LARSRISREVSWSLDQVDAALAGCRQRPILPQDAAAFVGNTLRDTE